MVLTFEICDARSKGDGMEGVEVDECSIDGLCWGGEWRKADQQSGFCLMSLLHFRLVKIEGNGFQNERGMAV